MALKNKIDSDGRMPSISSIHELLVDVGIKHSFNGESLNVVEFKTAGRNYVNSRHNGKSGKEIKFRAFVKDGKQSPFTSFGKESRTEWVHLDSSNSYYSWNSARYAKDLLNVLDNYKNMEFEIR